MLKLFQWQSRTVSLACNTLILGFLTIYCTDTLGMPAALVGTLLMASKIFDGASDLIAGFIVDRTNTQIGRARPYELCIIGLWGCTWLLYSCPPEFGLLAKSIWVFFMYAFSNSIFATFLNASHTAYMVRAFSKREYYVKLSSYGSIITMMGAVIVNVSFIVASLGYFVNFFAYDNFPILVIGSLLMGVGNIPVSMLYGLLVIDCAEYNEWKGKPRMEGTLGCITGFTTKIGAAVGAGLLGLVLGVSGFNSGAQVQTDAALMAIRSLYTLIPMALYLLVAFVITFYKLDTLMPQIRKENEERRNQVAEK